MTPIGQSIVVGNVAGAVGLGLQQVGNSNPAIQVATQASATPMTSGNIMAGLYNPAIQVVNQASNGNLAPTAMTGTN